MSAQQTSSMRQSRPRTLEYRQAMKDFHTMFPTIERKVIECVLRSNNGHVDSTIDQLLQINQENASSNHQRPTHARHMFEESTDSSCSISPEPRYRTSSSDEDEIRLPRYTPSYVPPPPAFEFPSRPAQVRDQKSRSQPTSQTYKDWNPPMLGSLPHDFLRILPTRTSSSSRLSTSRSSTSRSSTSRSSTSRSSASRSSTNKQSRTRSLHHSSSPNRDHRNESDSSSAHRNFTRRRTTGQLNVLFNDSSSHHQRMVMLDSPREVRSQHRHQRSSSSPHQHRRRKRTQLEEDQYVEDRKFALLLQNEEFMKELRRNDEFLRELRTDSQERPNTSSSSQASRSNPREKFAPITVDPMKEAKPPVSPQDEEDFQESVKHMGKSARKTFNELARKFTRRKSYKTMNNIDPVFANCSDNEDFY